MKEECIFLCTLTAKIKNKNKSKWPCNIKCIINNGASYNNLNNILSYTSTHECVIYQNAHLNKILKMYTVHILTINNILIVWMISSTYSQIFIKTWTYTNSINYKKMILKSYQQSFGAITNIIRLFKLILTFFINHI